MHQRFPCKSTLGVSHLIHFELVSCRQLKRASRYLNDQVISHVHETLSTCFLISFNKITLFLLLQWQMQEFSTAYHVCLMDKLLPFYEKKEVNCNEVTYEIHSARRQCLLDGGICSVPNQGFIFDRTNDLQAYPYMIPDSWEYLPLENKDIQLPAHYYRHATLFQVQVSQRFQLCQRFYNTLNTFKRDPYRL